VAAGRLKGALGIPVVMNFLDHLTGFMESWPRWLMPRSVLRRLMAYELSLPQRHDADAVLTVSDELAERFAQMGFDEDRLLPIYFGHDAELFRLSTEPKPDVPTVVMHGSFDRHHLGPIALDAIVAVSQARPETRFLFVGRETGALRGLLRKIRKRAPGAHLECTGFVHYQEIAGQLGRAHAGIIPYESSSGAHCAFVAKLVEYLAMGLPVVSTPLAGVQRYFEGTESIRFSEFDGRQFAQDLLDVLENPPSAAVLEKAATSVACKLDWSTICDRAVDRLELVVEEVHTRE